jgi:hypothetical protein
MAVLVFDSDLAMLGFGGVDVQVEAPVVSRNCVSAASEA